MDKPLPLKTLLSFGEFSSVPHSILWEDSETIPDKELVLVDERHAHIWDI